MKSSRNVKSGKRFKSNRMRLPYEGLMVACRRGCVLPSRTRIRETLDMEIWTRMKVGA